MLASLPKTIFAVLAMASSSMSLASTAPTLLIGDPAPTLAATRTIRGETIRQFDADRIYVVEFWATWCGPCKKFMPHISELARTYRDRVTFVSVNISERAGDPRLTNAAAVERVARFVRTNAAVMDYAVAMDDDAGTTKAQWQDASGLRGIPCAYIVADRKFVWIGSPMDLDAPLAEVVAGRYQSVIAKAQQWQGDIAEAERLRTLPALEEARRTNDYAAQVKIFEDMFAQNPRLEEYFSMAMFRSMLHVDPARASRYAQNCIDNFTPAEKKPIQRSVSLGAYAKTILQEPNQAHPPLERARQFAQESLDVAPIKEGQHYATLASVYFALHDIPKAIQMQESAIALVAKNSDEDPDKSTLLARYKSTLSNYELAARKAAKRTDGTS